MVSILVYIDLTALSWACRKDMQGSLSLLGGLYYIMVKHLFVHKALWYMGFVMAVSLRPPP
jgi:hypothetical protein